MRNGATGDSVEEHPGGGGREKGGHPIPKARGKPLLCISSKMYSHLTESKSFRMSSLKSSTGIFSLLNLVARFLTYKKLSWMLRFFMKALWAFEISSFM
jgi:hypothetical protein